LEGEGQGFVRENREQMEAPVNGVGEIVMRAMWWMSHPWHQIGRTQLPKNKVGLT
jgi:hypothetical protein